jgi:Mg-chelatase subunit ChlD
MSTKSKFTLFGLNGEPKAHYEVEEETADLGEGSASSQPAGHSIIVVDRSGSMWSDIGPLKDMLIKLLTLDEYRDAEMLVSLISYSTCGDCTLHFERESVQDVMKINSPFAQQIKDIDAWGLTCVSQAMSMAQGLIRDEEATCITVHSDGYANDPSVWSEQKQVESVVQGLKKANAFVNTIAYRESSDFRFLSSIANAASGKCVQANSVKAAYDVLYDGAKAVCGVSTPPIEYPIGNADYQVFVCPTQERVNGSTEDMRVAGLSKGDLGTLYRFTEISQADYDGIGQEASSEAILAFSRGKLAEGSINEAKYAMYSSRLIDLTKKHLRALASPQLAEMAADLEASLFEDGGEEPTAELEPLGSNVTVLQLASVLEGHRDKILVNLSELGKGYQRRGVQRVPGVRGEDGNIEAPWLEVENLDDGEWTQMGTFDVNRTSATMNLLLARPSRLVKTADSSPITEVAGLNVGSLTSFRNFTIVGDGEVTVPEFVVKFGSEDAYEAVKSLGVIKDDDGTFDFSKPYTLAVDSLPPAPFDFDGDLGSIKGSFRQVLCDKVAAGILSAITKEESDDLTSDQIEELGKHYLSKNLNINFPTTTPYSDLQEALQQGTIDTRVSFKVEIGDADILNPGRVKSANAFLDRHYEAYSISTGDKLKDKPKMPMFLDAAIGFRHKTLSARTKITAVDDFARPIFDAFLGLGDGAPFASILSDAGINKSVMDLVRGGSSSLLEALKAVEAHQDRIYREEIAPLVFFVGATGLMPDAVEAKAETADEIEVSIEGLKLAKAEKEGTFFRVGEAVVSVYPKDEYFSTGKEE